MTDEVKNHPNKENETPMYRMEEKSSVTHHSISIGEKTLSYTVTAGIMILKEEDVEVGEKEKAALFYTSYILDTPEEAPSRPITFAFNGGPGSSSVWLHLGALGPKRVKMEDEGWMPKIPAQLVDNEFTILEATDIVFIDPVSTGYSRTVPKEKPEQFLEATKDVQSVGEFIRLWTTRNKRWNSPKFLIGESYGTTRAAGLAGFLHTKYGMYLNGIMFVSSILSFITGRFHPGNDLPYILFLPTYTATAWYHGKLRDSIPAKLEKVVADAVDFARGDYAQALMKGNLLTPAQYKRTAQKVARFTGLSVSYVERSNLRINIHRFCKELRRDEKITVGRLDSRFTGFDRDAVGEMNEADPSYTAILGPYTSTLYDYLRSDLEFELDKPYEILISFGEKWRFEDSQNRYLNTAEDLRKAMLFNPQLKALVLCGYYDLATPFAAAEYTFQHIELPERMKANIEFKYYEAGHMMYIHLPSLQKMANDLINFINASK